MAAWVTYDETSHNERATSERCLNSAPALCVIVSFEAQIKYGLKTY